jgi:DNA-binding transcriptional MerR regulator
MTLMTISQLARRTGVRTSTLRYYEKVGVIPPASRTDSGYRLYDDDALARLAFVQRVKALGVELDDVADLVRLWDGSECAPVQERLRSLVHEQRGATRTRLDNLTQLAQDLDAVSASIGDAECGPDCACVSSPVSSDRAHLPMADERLIGAACTLGSDDMRERLREWGSLRARATRIEPLAGGARLSFARDEPVESIAGLAARESECCAFYTFALVVDGAERHLDITAGAAGAAAVHALIGMDE